jgi:hypothetical protein
VAVVKIGEDVISWVNSLRLFPNGQGGSEIGPRDVSTSNIVVGSSEVRHECHQPGGVLSNLATWVSIVPNAARRAILIEYNLAFDFEIFHLGALDSLPKEAFLVAGSYCKAELDTSGCNVEFRGIPKSRKPRSISWKDRVTSLLR